MTTHVSNSSYLRSIFVEAEEQPEISEAYSVSAVPHFVFIKDGKTVDTLEGADPSSLANKVAKVSGSISPADPAAPASLGMAAGPTILETVKELAKENVSSQGDSHPPSKSYGLEKRLQQLIESHPIMLFMKGNPKNPQCGFSSKVVDILNKEKVEFGSFDILSNNEVREGLKKLSNWPTFPQLYCNGELLGGCDIAIAMHESGEFREVFNDHGIGATEVKIPEPAGGISESNGLNSSLNSRLSSLINSSPVMLFMKGKPDEPKCGFSRKVVDILNQERVDFKSFDILTDDEVRQGLKAFSNWSNYPQLYVKGELLGGSDIVLEMQKSGELEKVFAELYYLEEMMGTRWKGKGSKAKALADPMSNIVSKLKSTLTEADSHGILAGSSVLLAIPTPHIELFKRACFGRPIVTSQKDEQWFQLSLEEAFFLCYDLKCIKIMGENENLKTDDELWKYMKSKRVSFPIMFKAYAYFRTRNWVVRSGSQYGVDFVAYRHHPALVHSEYAVLVQSEQDGDVNGRLRVWSDFQCTLRLCGSVAKTLLVLRIDKKGAGVEFPKCLEMYCVEPRTITRWSPEQSRERKPKS